MNKQLIILALGATMVASCADDFDRSYEVGRPDNVENYAYLNNYKPLKEYVANPNMKLGVGTDIQEYMKQELVYGLTNSNFTEVVAGNAMKMASCVNDKGEMDFSNVQQFVSMATDAGLSVYGHTLAWHAQQPAKYLNSLIQDKEMEVDPNAKEEKEQYTMDWTTASGYNMWHGGDADGHVTVGEEGLMVNSVIVDPWYGFQFFVADNITLEAGKDYVLRLELKGSPASENLHYVIGPWGTDVKGGVLDFPDGEWVPRDITFTASDNYSGVHVMLQSGDYEGQYSLKSVTLYSLEVPMVELPSYIYENDFSGSDVPGGWGNNSTRVIEDGVLHVNNPSATDFWSAQMAIDGYQFEQGVTYYMSMKIKGSGDGVWRSGAQVTTDYSSAGDFPTFEFTTEWKEVSGKFICSKDGATRWIHSFGDFAGDIYIDDLKLYIMKPMNTIPLTDQEKKDTLTWAMSNWIEGMMNACEGKVMAWDVVNEAVSGGNADAEGVYALQHESENASDFFWQNYLGDVDYVRTAVKLARQFGPDGVKLFVNDYNLESDWDENGKLKSLIAWIKRWEADGVTKIDGIGTQMHISYYMNPQTQASKSQALENSFRLMAATGKLVRISELDMGLVDENGNDVNTVDVTEEQHKAMAEYYKWIIQKYLEIVPQAQQWGITQWCITDSPADSGWRKGQPTGLWDQNYNRKHTYAGFADGLQSK